VPEIPVMTNRPCFRSLLALGVLGAACGCSALDNCPDAQDDITIDRPEDTDTTDLVFNSSKWDDKLDPFPAKTQLKFKHYLGVTPEFVQPYLSFSTNGTNGAAGGSVTPTAGNETAIECVDSQEIIIKNDTCERSFFIKVVAFGSPKGDRNDTTCSGGTNEPDGAGGATGAAGAPNN